MKYILSGTNRPGSRSLQIAKIIQSTYAQLGEQYDVLDLSEFPFHLVSGSLYGKPLPPEAQQWVEKMTAAEALVVVVPEYNGSMPGALKYFIDFWDYPATFEYRPIALVGLGGSFGGLRPVEHLQQVFNYRNAYVFPERVFVREVWTNLKDGKIVDNNVNQLLERQARHFTRFVNALKAEKLDANSARESQS